MLLLFNLLGFFCVLSLSLNYWICFASICCDAAFIRIWALKFGFELVLGNLESSVDLLIILKIGCLAYVFSYLFYLVLIFRNSVLCSIDWIFFEIYYFHMEGESQCKTLGTPTTALDPSPSSLAPPPVSSSARHPWRPSRRTHPPGPPPFTAQIDAEQIGEVKSSDIPTASKGKKWTSWVWSDLI